MLRLETFGGLTLSIGGIERPQPRRRLALLARLAPSREIGVSRAELLADLWPDRDEDTARHSLDQLLYEMRKSLSASPVIGTATLRLDPNVISADVMEFAAAFERADYADAVARYGGAFLQGFYLQGASEFERWVETNRDRLAAQFRNAIEHVAKNATARGAHEEAVRWWRQLASIDRLSSPVALGLMRALAESGDSVGALEYARVYERIVRVELETAPDPTVVSFAASLKVADADTPSSNARPAVGSTTEPHAADAAVPDGVGEKRFDGAIRPSPARVTLLGRGTLLISTAAVVLLVFAYASRRRNRDDIVEMAAAATAAAPASIVVLPVTDVSARDSGDRLADGMTEQLISGLTSTNGLRVIDRRSGDAFKIGSVADLRRIGDSLHVSNILATALQRDGQRLRVTVRLVDATTGVARWAHTYDRELSDVFAVQDDIVQAVARELSVRLAGTGAGVAGRHRTTNIAAYELYLRGSDPALTRTDSGARAGVKHFEGAVALDSMYAAAYAGMAMLRMVASNGRDVPPDRRRAMHARALEDARHARRLDDSCAVAHLALGNIHLFAYEFRDAEIELRRAHDLDPGLGDASGLLTVVYEWTGRTAEGVAEAQREALRDPLSANVTANLAGALYFARRFDEALAQLQKVAAIRPPLRRAYEYRATTLLAQRRWADAIAVLRPLAPQFPRARALLAYALGRSGARPEALEILAQLRADLPTGKASAFAVAEAYAGLGDFDQAFAWLARSFEDRTLLLAVMGPAFDDLRADPRFAEMRKRLGLDNTARPE